MTNQQGLQQYLASLMCQVRDKGLGWPCALSWSYQTAAISRINTTLATPIPPQPHVPVLSRLAGMSILTCVESNQQQEAAAADSAPIGMFVEHLLSAPGLMAVLSDGVAGRLLQPTTLDALLHAAESMGQTGAMHGCDAAALLGNISQLVLGKPGQTPATNASALLQQHASPVLATTAAAVPVYRVVLQLLPAAASGASSSKVTASQAAVVSAQLGLLCAQAPLLQLMSDDMPLFAGVCLHLLQDLPNAQALLLKSSSNSSSGSSVTGSTSAGDAALNTLAFVPQVLPIMWRWLSISLGLPIEAPVAARLGLDVESMAGGCRRLQPHHALVLAVFCRWVDGWVRGWVV